MPTATIRACAPSCRSRSIRRSSATAVSVASLRVLVSPSTRRASACARSASSKSAVQVGSRRASRQPAATSATPSSPANSPVILPSSGTAP